MGRTMNSNALNSGRGGLICRARITRSSPVVPKTKEGRSFPLGATVFDEGRNLSVHSKHATAIELLLFGDVEDAQPARVISIDPATNRTSHYWHTF
jgi:glycogen operon protein